MVNYLREHPKEYGYAPCVLPDGHVGLCSVKEEIVKEVLDKKP